jgi:hypothetical protein
MIGELFKLLEISEYQFIWAVWMTSLKDSKGKLIPDPKTAPHASLLKQKQFANSVFWISMVPQV